MATIETTQSGPVSAASAVGGRNPGTVLITGGASGLGAAVAVLVADAGGTPIVLDMNAPAGDIEFHKVDLADTATTEATVAEVIAAHPSIDGVVTAAGIDRCGRLDDVPTDAWERVVAVNLFGTASVVRAAIPALVAVKGRIVTVASTLGLRGFSDATAYCASKFGVVGFTRALSAELAGKVGVTLLIPGGMQTHFFDDRDPQYKPGPDTLLNDPSNVARTILFALSQPEGCEVKELLVTHSAETSWP